MILNFQAEAKTLRSRPKYSQVKTEIFGLKASVDISDLYSVSSHSAPWSTGTILLT